MDERALDLLEVWWAIGEEGWYSQSDETDAMLTERFGDLVKEARAGALGSWKDTPHTALALLLLLDQLPRNIYRGTPEAFASDTDAMQLADYARANRFDMAYNGVARGFFYMPYMHCEDIDAQNICCDIFRQIGNQNGYYYALVHMDAIRRFGRFPHRNKILGRISTPQEDAYMASGGFSA
ncbi:MAG: DUF924 family protein [Devosiaceae bacterium]